MVQTKFDASHFFLHMRPVQILCTIANLFQSEARMKCADAEANVKSTLDGIAFAARLVAINTKHTITFTISGSDEQVALETIEACFAEHWLYAHDSNEAECLLAKSKRVQKWVRIKCARRRSEATEGVKRRAQEIWERSGRLPNRDRENWLEAERQWLSEFCEEPPIWVDRMSEEPPT